VKGSCIDLWVTTSAYPVTIEFPQLSISRNASGQLPMQSYKYALRRLH